ncbi:MULTISPECIES: hypothetical protein [Pseudomonas]|uniref:hypothetical protein n=1 Tax=Pseudomonas TaxID=286 RepID=UPI001F186A3C|nr:MULTISPECIES: hypothetical protein [Pseudomonas]MCF5226034.1 hypothetical protein [Pseudomonas syringae]MCF5243208.1 hypothetical protein [Pseudomonas syringae]
MPIMSTIRKLLEIAAADQAIVLDEDKAFWMHRLIDAGYLVADSSPSQPLAYLRTHLTAKGTTFLAWLND